VISRVARTVTMSPSVLMSLIVVVPAATGVTVITLLSSLPSLPNAAVATFSLVDFTENTTSVSTSVKASFTLLSSTLTPSI